VSSTTDQSKQIPFLRLPSVLPPSPSSLLTLLPPPPLTLLQVIVLDHGSIETDSVAEFHAVFSNKWLGGGLLHAGGYAQEEMVFVLRPESIVSLLLCPDSEEMEDNEAIVISGAECFSSHTCVLFFVNFYILFPFFFYTGILFLT
jgi:hypothetical protein